ncbi:MAG TPA: hypothetical protein VFD69_08000 [Vicinamibacterales bacterium]|nr:hypothetical protein [Vicinamibacterales bacterium]
MKIPLAGLLVVTTVMGIAPEAAADSALIVASHGGSDDIPRAMLNVCAPPALAGFAVGAMVDALR